MNITKLTMSEEYHSVYESCITFMMDALTEYVRCIPIRIDEIEIEKDLRKILMKNILIENE
jgi:hypothetical protein